MKIINRLFITLTRNKKKNFVLFSIIFLIGLVINSNYIINRAVNATTNEIRRTTPPILTLIPDMTTINYQYFENYFPSVSNIDSKIIYEISNLPYVRMMYYTIIPTTNSTSLIRHGEVQSGLFNMIGVSTTDFFFANEGFIDIAQGRTFTNEELHLIELPLVAPIIISDKIANLNGLTIGSQIEFFELLLNLPDVFDISDLNEFIERKYFEFEVIGIFTYNPPLHIDEYYQDHVFTQILNQFYIPNWRASQLLEYAVNFIIDYSYSIDTNNHSLADFIKNHMEVIWVLYNALDMDNFKTAAYAILPDYWTFETATRDFSHVIHTFDLLDSITNQMFWFFTVLMIVATYLLIYFTLDERKHEHAIYLSLGESKKKIFLLIFIEVLIIGTIAIVFSIIISNYFAEYLGQYIILNHFESHRVNPHPKFNLTIDLLGFNHVLSPQEMIELFRIDISIKHMIQIYLGFISILFISCISAFISIFKSSTSKLLTKAKIG